MRILDNTKLWISKPTKVEISPGEYTLHYENPIVFWLNTRVLTREETIDAYGEYRKPVLQIIDYMGNEIYDNSGIWLNEPINLNEPEFIVNTFIAPTNSLFKKGNIISASKA